MWLLLIANCLRKVHEQDVTHRATAPENVLVCQGSRGVQFRLANFQYAHLASEQRLMDPPKCQVRAGYAAPEGNVTPRPQAQDYYSLGVIVFQVRPQAQGCYSLGGIVLR